MAKCKFIGKNTSFKMLVVLSSIFVADTKITFIYNFVAPLSEDLKLKLSRFKLSAYYSTNTLDKDCYILNITQKRSTVLALFNVDILSPPLLVLKTMRVDISSDFSCNNFSNFLDEIGCLRQMTNTHQL